MDDDPRRRSISDIDTEVDYGSDDVFCNEDPANVREIPLRKHWTVALVAFIFIALSIASVTVAIEALTTSAQVLRNTDVKAVQQLKTTVSELHSQIHRQSDKLKSVEEQVNRSPLKQRSKAQAHSVRLEKIRIANNENENLLRELGNFTKFENSELSKRILGNTEQLFNLQKEMKKTEDQLKHLKNSSESFDTTLEKQVTDEATQSLILSQRIQNLENTLKNLLIRMNRAEVANRNLSNILAALSKKSDSNASVQNKLPMMAMVLYTIFGLFLRCPHF